MVTATWLKKFPNTAAAFRRALVKAQAIAATDPAAVQQGMEASAECRRRRVSRPPASPDPVERGPALKRLEKFMHHFNMSTRLRTSTRCSRSSGNRGPRSCCCTGSATQAASVSTETCQSSAALRVQRVGRNPATRARLVQAGLVAVLEVPAADAVEQR